MHLRGVWDAVGRGGEYVGGGDLGPGGSCHDDDGSGPMGCS